MPSDEELYRLYLQFNDDFLKDNPEAFGQYGHPPSFEGFQFTLQRLRSSPEAQETLNGLINQWQRGWMTTSKEVREKIEILNKKYFGIGKGLLNISEENLRKYTDECCNLIAEVSKHLKYI